MLFRNSNLINLSQVFYVTNKIHLHFSRRNTRPERTAQSGESRGVESATAIAYENGVEERERPCTVEAATLQGTV